MLRRGLALGGGLVLLIIVVLGVKGCLDARANRALEDYARNVTQIVEETQQTSKKFFERLEDPGNASVTDFVDQVNADRSAVDTQATRIDELDTPGDLERAQANLELAYRLRASAMDEIAEKTDDALGDAGAEKATAAIARQMEKLFASDVIYEQVVRPEVDGVLATNGVSDSDLPKSTFLPDPKWLDEGEVSEALGAISGNASSDVAGVHGTELTGVTVGGTELVEGVPATISAAEGVEVEASVLNSGESAETGITVSVTFEGNTIKGEIDELQLGEIGTALIPLTPTPSGEVTLEVVVDALPGEELTENNEATYSLVVE